MATLEEIQSIKDNVTHVLDDHEDHQAEMRVIARHLGMTWEVFRQEVIDEAPKVVTRPSRR